MCDSLLRARYLHNDKATYIEEMLQDWEQVRNYSKQS